MLTLRLTVVEISSYSLIHNAEHSDVCKTCKDDTSVNYTKSEKYQLLISSMYFVFITI